MSKRPNSATIAILTYLNEHQETPVSAQDIARDVWHDMAHLSILRLLLADMVGRRYITHAQSGGYQITGLGAAVLKETEEKEKENEHD